jgi:hypothetical protein
LLLALYLRDHGYVVQSVRANHENGAHFWLLVNGWNIDITENQFPEISEPVIIGRIADLPWHKEHTSAHQVQDAWPRPGYLPDYERVYALLKEWLERN